MASNRRLGRPTPAEEREDIRELVKNPDTATFYDSVTDVSREYTWVDGNIIGIATGGEYNLYIFKRTAGSTEPDGGTWLKIGTTNGALVW